MLVESVVVNVSYFLRLEFFSLEVTILLIVGAIILLLLFWGKGVFFRTIPSKIIGLVIAVAGKGDVFENHWLPDVNCVG